MTAVDRQAPVPPAPEVERELAFDMLKRGVWFAPAILLVSTMIWGTEGAASAAVAIAVVAVNLLLAAISLSWAAKISLTAIMAVALGGFAVRMAPRHRRALLGPRRQLDRHDGARRHRARHAPRAPVLGAPLRVRFARLPGPQAHL